MNISILLPTRGRPRLVERLLDSIVKTTLNPKGVEVVLYIDSDDSESRSIVFPRGLNHIVLVRPRGNTMGKMFIECYRHATGRYTMLMNDDAVFRTRGWDTSVLKAFSGFPDDVALAYCNDMDQGEKTPTFPVISRAVCELTGGVAPPDYANLHIESHIMDIFAQLKNLGHDRIAYLREVLIEHKHFAIGKAAMDNTYASRNLDKDDRVFVSYEEERLYAAKKIAAYIRRQDPLSDGGGTPDVTIIITGAGGFECVNSILSAKQSPDATFEIIMAGNEKDAAMYSVETNAVRFVDCAGNMNACELADFLASRARGRFLAFLSPTARVSPDWLKHLVNAVEADEKAAIAGSKVIEPRNSRVLHAGITFFGDTSDAEATYIYQGFKSVHPAVCRKREVQAVCMNGMLVRSGVFFEAGGFSKGCVNLCLKLREAGFKVFYEPSAIISEHGVMTQSPNNPIEYAVTSDTDAILREDGFELVKHQNGMLLRPLEQR